MISMDNKLKMNNKNNLPDDGKHRQQTQWNNNKNNKTE